MTYEERVDIGYLCGECAEDLGWRWLEGHCATYHTANCGVCGVKKALTCWDDWIVEGEKKMSFVNWD